MGTPQTQFKFKSALVEKTPTQTKFFLQRHSRELLRGHEQREVGQREGQTPEGRRLQRQCLHVVQSQQIQQLLQNLAQLLYERPSRR